MAREPLEHDPSPSVVRTITFVPFMPDGSCAIVRDQRGTLRLPNGELHPDEHFLDASLRIPLETAGFRMQRFHSFAIDGDHLFAWLDGDRYGPGGSMPCVPSDLIVEEPDSIIQRLRTIGDHATADIVEQAARSFHSLSEQSYYDDNLHMLERAYLLADTPQGGSGFGRDAAAWRNAREHIVDAIEGDGTFLDVGCANGLLMESAVSWAAERDVVIEPYGVDLAPGLIQLARRRLPRWADRFWIGNAITWRHPQGVRFDYVHALFDFVPLTRRADMVNHLLKYVVANGGRLIVSQYFGSGSTEMPSTAEVLHELGFHSSGESEPATPGFARRASTAWIDRA